MYLPTRRRRSTSHVTAAQARNTTVTTERLSPKIFVSSARKIGGSSRTVIEPSRFEYAVIFLPPERSFASPRAKTIIASVTTNGCSRNRATNVPENARSAAPPARTAVIASGAESPSSVDPRVGLALDAAGAAMVWGAFSGAIRFEGGNGPALQSQGSDRFLARVQIDGAVGWSQVLRAVHTDDYSVAVHRDGGVTLAAVVRPRANEEHHPTSRDRCVARLDATGKTTQRTRHPGAPHACARVMVASTGATGIALAGYFSGSFTIAGQAVRSTTASSESVLVAGLGGAGGSWVRALHGPELQAGLSVHGDASGAVVLAGWCAGGAMDLGGERIEPGERAAFFVARYS